MKIERGRTSSVFRSSRLPTFFIVENQRFNIIKIKMEEKASMINRNLLLSKKLQMAKPATVISAETAWPLKKT